MPVEALTFLAIIFGGSLLSFTLHPVWGLYAYVIVFYMDAPSRWWGPSVPDLRWSLILSGVTVVATIIHKTRQPGEITRPSFVSHAPQALYLVFLVWIYVQYLWETTGPDHTIGVTYFTKYAIIMYLIYAIVDNRERVIGFLTAHVLGCFYLGLLAFTSNRVGRLDGIGGSGIDDANSLGLYMATAAIVAGGLYFSTKNWLRLLPVVVLPFTLNTLVQTGSRAAFLALVLGSAAVYFYRPQGKTMKLIAYGAAGIVLFGFLASNFYWDRMASIKDAAQQTEQADSSAMSRFQIIEDQWRMAVDHPFGVGHKGTAMLSYQYIDELLWSEGGGRASHNTFMSALVDHGFIGLLLWGALSWKLFLKCRDVVKWARHEDDLQLSWLAAIILGVATVVWVAGAFAPYIRAEVFIWMIPLICSLWAESVGRATVSVPDPKHNAIFNDSRR